MTWRKELTRTTALAAAFLLWSLAAAGATGQQRDTSGRRPAAQQQKHCPARADLDASLVTASDALQQSRYDTAIQSLRRIPLDCDSRISLLLAAAFESNGNLPEAERTLQRAHFTWPENTSIATSLAREYLSSGQAKEAAKALENLHASASMPWQEMQLSTVVFFADHQLVKAEAIGELGYKTYPSVQSLLLLANALQLEGRYKDVIRLLEGKRAEYGQSPKFLVTLAESEFDDKLFDAAHRDLQRAVELDPGLYQAHYLLGNVQQQLGDMDQAVAEYRRSIELAPNQPRTYYQLALALRAKQDEAGEESALAKALAIDDHFALAHSEMGRILLNENRVEDAVAQLNLAIQSNPSLEQPYNLLARAYMRLGETEKANAMAKRLAAVRSANHRTGTSSGAQGEEDGPQTP